MHVPFTTESAGQRNSLSPTYTWVTLAWTMNPEAFPPDKMTPEDVEMAMGRIFRRAGI